MAADDFSIEDDGYSFSSPVNRLVNYYLVYFLSIEQDELHLALLCHIFIFRFILRFPSLCKLPFIPPKRKIESVEDLRNRSFSSKESGSSISKPFSVSAPSLINTISAKL